jgi:hypothetical protein
MAVLGRFAVRVAPKLGRDLAIATEQAGRLVASGRPPWSSALHDLAL